MESALCLSFCPCPSPANSPRIPSTMSVKHATKLRSSRHSSISLSSSSTHHPRRQIVSHVICAHDKSSLPPEDRKRKEENKIVKGTVGASLVLACALGVMSCSSNMNPIALAGPKEVYQKAPSMSVFAHPVGGRHALNSFLDVSLKLASSKPEPFYWPRYTVPPGPSMADVNAIKVKLHIFSRQN